MVIKRSSLQSIYDALLHIIFPQNCAGCNLPFRGKEKVLCLRCKMNLPLSNTWLHDKNLFSEKIYGRFTFQKACSFIYFNQSGLTQHLIHLVKYKDRKDIAEYLGRLFGEHLKNSQWAKEIDYLVPVPLHKQKRYLRGYNQSEVIAEGMSAILEIPHLKNSLIKTKHTTSQTKKTTKERIENVKDVFELTNPKELIGKHILLVDDVITTGATLESCSQIILKLPHTRISLATLAIAEQ